MYLPAMVAVKFLGMGLPELLIIMVIALVIFGPKNLPKLGETLGKTVRGVREGIEGEKTEQTEAVVKKVVEEVEIEADDEDEYEEVVVRRKKNKTEDS